MTASEPSAASAAQPRALVFIYDRATTPTPLRFELRLMACRDLAREQDWEIAGWWADTGSDALTQYRRPALALLLDAMAKSDRTRPRYLLVYDWTRLANPLDVQAAHSRRVRLAGGETRSVTGSSSAAPARRRLSSLLRVP